MVVGGTGLYVKTLVEGPHGTPPSTAESRAHIDRVVEEEDGGVGPRKEGSQMCMPERAALIKSILNFLKKAIPEPTFAENIRTCRCCLCIAFSHPSHAYLHTHTHILY